MALWAQMQPELINCICEMKLWYFNYNKKNIYLVFDPFQQRAPKTLWISYDENNKGIFYDFNEVTFRKKLVRMKAGEGNLD